MKNKKAATELEQGRRDEEEQARLQELEILKAVAQAWLGHSGNPQATSEFDARRLNFKPQPSRFRVQAMNENNPRSSLSTPKGMGSGRSKGSGYWDFGQSLWDSYEILAVSKKLESGMVPDDPFKGITARRRESKNSLRNLFNLVSSRRFNESNIPQEHNSQF